MKSDNKKTVLMICPMETVHTEFKSAHSQLKKEGTQVSALVDNDWIRWWMQLWFSDVEFFTFEEFYRGELDTTDFDSIVGTLPSPSSTLL